MGETSGHLRIAVTAGDPFGIGPEVTRAAIEGLEAQVTVYGDPAQFPGLERIVPVPAKGERPEPAGPSEAGGRAALAALQLALEDLRQGRQDALVTAPISKQSAVRAGGQGEGHTPLLGQFFGVEEPLMAFVWDEREPVVALLTHHIPLRAVPCTLTSARVERAVRLLDTALKGRFRRGRARIGVLGLNPHAEEADFVSPAIERLRADGLEVAGPLPADAAFARREGFDGLLALYHDQGLAPVKALAFERAVNVTLGLPVIRTSPSHGTAFELAGTGRASPLSMRAALEWALRLSR
ncbi:MAG: PdxA family dehydrogenase [Planctomycetota bacterium]|jgi:4-hydroxythreonine-4-phosphate dehydrogenase